MAGFQIVEEIDYNRYRDGSVTTKESCKEKEDIIEKRCNEYYEKLNNLMDKLTSSSTIKEMSNILDEKKKLEEEYSDILG